MGAWTAPDAALVPAGRVAAPGRARGRAARRAGPDAPPSGAVPDAPPAGAAPEAPSRAPTRVKPTAATPLRAAPMHAAPTQTTPPLPAPAAIGRDAPAAVATVSGLAAPGLAVAELIAVLAAVTDGEPRVLTIAGGQALPSGPLEPGHRSLQAGLRAWVERQTHHPLGYVEQLYTFADRDRAVPDARHISISYLGLTREARAGGEPGVGWHSWYRFFPWEDQRAGGADIVAATIAPHLLAWADTAPDPAARRERRQRAAITFGLEGGAWNEELVLQRYELLWEAGLVAEAGATAPPVPGTPMRHDHRRILATAIARLRAKIKYRPVVFELLPGAFTLLHLQRTVEALAGRLLHKQNFRRLVESQDLVEETGETVRETGGRPAKLFRFRRAVRAERAVAGTKLPLARAG